jgi:hypothetical protein
MCSFTYVLTVKSLQLHSHINCRVPLKYGGLDLSSFGIHDVFKTRKTRTSCSHLSRDQPCPKSVGGNGFRQRIDSCFQQQKKTALLPASPPPHCETGCLGVGGGGSLISGNRSKSHGLMPGE